MNDSAHNSRKRWLVRALKLLLVVLLLWGVRRTLVSAFEEIRSQDWPLHYGWLAAAGGLYLLALLPSGCYWQLLLRKFGGEPHFLAAQRAYYIGHLGKYVPGKAMVVVLRAGLVRGEKVDGVAAAVAVFYETLTTMAAGAVVAAVIVAIWFREHALWAVLAVAMALAAGVPTWPPLASRLAKLLRIGKNRPELIEKLATLSPSTIAAGWLMTLAAWPIMGLSLWAVAMGVGADPPLAELPRYAACTALSTVAGFVSFVPGGLVVREAVLMELLAPSFARDAAATAAIVAVLHRVVGLLAEFLIHI